MVISSPRTQFRGLAPVLPEDPEDVFQRRMEVALRQLQAHMKLYPTDVKTITTSETMVDTDGLVLGDATGGNITYALLTAAAREGLDITVKKIDASENLVTIDPAGSETLDGKTSVSLLSKNATRTYKSDGTNWQLVAAIGNASEL